MDATTAAVADDLLQLGRRGQAGEAAGPYPHAHRSPAATLERAGASEMQAWLHESLRLASPISVEANKLRAELPMVMPLKRVCTYTRADNERSFRNTRGSHGLHSVGTSEEN